MYYGMKAFFALLLVLGVSGMSQAAPDGFTTQKEEGISMDVPTTWQMMPKDFKAKLQERNPGGTILMGAQGPDGGMPQMMVLSKEDPGSTPDKVSKMSAAEVKTWCDSFVSNIKTQSGRDIPINCQKTRLASGEALFTQMTLPTPQAEMISMTWTVPGKEKSVSMTVMFAKSLEDKVVPQIKKMAESLNIGK